MISNFKNQSRKDDIKLLLYIVIGFLFVAWLCTPPGNKFLQMCFWGNNTKYFFSKVFNAGKQPEYIFHRNNAVYLAKMYPNRKSAIYEMDKAIASLPAEAPDKILQSLHKDRAEIKLFLGDHKGALSDFMNSGEISFNDKLKVALLFRVAGNYRDAVQYCNSILNLDTTAYAGYACLADVYTNIGRSDYAIKVWDLALSRTKANARIYLDKALIKKSIGDMKGYEEDMELAKHYDPLINESYSIIEDTLHPKILSLSIKKS